MPKRAPTPMAVDRVRFDAFEFDLATGELRGRGRFVRLAPNLHGFWQFWFLTTAILLAAKSLWRKCGAKALRRL